MTGPGEDGPTPQLGTGPDPDATAALGDAAAQVQDAVLALVAVGRAALDLVERLARDPAPLLDAASRMATAGRAATPWAEPTAATDEADGATAAPPQARPRVQHIRVEQAEG